MNFSPSIFLVEIENLNRFLISKRKLFLTYGKEFSKVNDVRLIKNPQFSKSNNWLNTIFIKNSSIKKRNKVLSLGQKNKIFLRPVWKPLHTLKYLNKMPRMNLDVAIKIYESCINLPSSASYFGIRR